MNIFYLSHDVEECARFHVDKHVSKLAVELCQILCTNQRLSGNTDERLYKATHVNHPSTVWARQSKANYLWTHSLFVALLNEYNYRYGKIHACSRFVDLLSLPPSNLPDGGFTQPTQAMADEFKCDDSIVAYRNYYKCGKKHLHAWKNRSIPSFILGELQ